MAEEELIQGIVLNPEVMVGKPVIRGTRLTVDYILNLFANGADEKEVLEEYSGLTQKDIRACFYFATKTLRDTDYMPL